jgi:DnaA family protein
LSQLALPLKLHDHAVFESFLPAGNEALVAFLTAIAATADGPGGWRWGSAATGKTHLLQALCARVGDRAVYLPLSEPTTVAPAMLDGLASREFVCLDDLDTVAGDPDWELGLFRLYNELIDAGGILLATAKAAQRECKFELADLVSRFALLPSFHVHALDEAGRINALKLRASHRGLDLPDETANYLLNRSKRDMASLYALLDKLDSAALKAQRRLTIPFVRQVFESMP